MKQADTRLAITLVRPGHYEVAVMQCEEMLATNRIELGDLQELVILALEARNLPGDKEIIKLLESNCNNYL